MENTNNIPTAYEGKEPYIFVSYAHKDSAKVLPVLSHLVENGYRVWYDAGIEAGEDWPESVATHLANAETVLIFLSANALASHNCTREIHFAISKQKPSLTIYLEDVALTLGMEMQLGVIQAIFHHKMKLSDFYHTLFSTKCLQNCKVLEGTQHFKKSPFEIKDGALIKYNSDEDATTVLIPEGVKKICESAFDFSCSIEQVIIPQSVTQIESGAFDSADFETIIVDSYNSEYSSEDGVLFNKDKTELIRYPISKKTKKLYSTPNSTYN